LSVPSGNTGWFARANMLSALMGGKALTASELANEAGVTAQTASAHLAKLESGGLIAAITGIPMTSNPVTLASRETPAQSARARSTLLSSSM